MLYLKTNKLNSVSNKGQRAVIVEVLGSLSSPISLEDLAKKVQATGKYHGKGTEGHPNTWAMEHVGFEGSVRYHLNAMLKAGRVKEVDTGAKHVLKAIDLGPDTDGRMQKPAINPWLELREQAPYVLAIDRDRIERHNAGANSDRTIDTSLVPEPFIGDPASARVVLLNLNPGWAEGDPEAHADPEFRAAIFRNLRHESQEDPFFPLNPKFERTPCAIWWRKKTKELVAECGRETVAARLLVIEWFPYHPSKKPRGLICKSQSYSFQLARQMLDSGRLVVLLRAREEWSAVDERCSELRLPNSRQNPCITPKNVGVNMFKRIKAALCNGHMPE